MHKYLTGASKGTVRPERRKSRQTACVPTSKSLLKRLFSKKWATLHEELFDAEEGQYPGVYILAYCEKNLRGSPIKLEDVFYVGMSHAGVVKRLGHFIKGLEKNKYHSAAKRYFRSYANGVPYLQLKKKKTFFFASVSVPCDVDKKSRTAIDLRKMGEVAKCEFYVLAHVREKLGFEPELNLK